MSLSLLSNFLLMGLQTISCFHLSYWFDLWPSHCLSWVQNLKIYQLSQVEEAVKKKIWTSLFAVSLESWGYSRFFCASLNLTQHSSAFGCIDKPNYAGSNTLFDLMKSSVFWVFFFWLLLSLKPDVVLFSGSLLLSIISIDYQILFCFLLFWLSWQGVVFNRAVSGFL